jgi:hypothetical protein
MFKDIKMKDVFTAYVCYEINHNKDLKKEVKEMIKDVTGELGRAGKYVIGELADRLEQIFEDYREIEQENLNTICMSLFDNFLVSSLERVNWNDIAEDLKI